MAIDSKLMTVEEFLDLDDNGLVHELLRGELIEVPPPGTRHGRVSHLASNLFDAAVESAGLGVVTDGSGTIVGRNPDSVLGPDLAIYLGQHLDAGDAPEGYDDDVPDVVVEVVSPRDRAGYIQDKVQTYLHAGVRMVVVVWPRVRQVTVCTPDGVTVTLGEDDTLDGGDLIPGVKIPVRGFFVRQ